MNLKDNIRRHRLVFQFQNMSHRHIIIDDHSLASILWFAAIGEHFLGNFTSGGSAFKLAGGNRFFHQRPDHVAIPLFRVGHLFGNLDKRSASPIDLVQEIGHQVGNGEMKTATVFILERNRFLTSSAAEL